MPGLEDYPTEDVPVLGIETLVAFLGLTNNEVKCLGLTALRYNVGIHEAALYEDVILDESGNEHVQGVTQDNIGLIFERMPDEVVQTKRWNRTGRVLVKTEIGELATILGGHLIDVSVTSGVPIRVFMGEHSTPSPNTNNPESFSLDSFEGRIIVFRSLLDLAKEGWVNSGELLKNFGQYGLERDAAHNHLTQLIEARIIAKRDNPNHKGWFQYKIAEANEDFVPVELIERLMDVFKKFVLLDDLDFVTRGREYANRYLADKDIVRSLVENSYSISKRFKNGRVA